jgi:D-sedoheptulose 7-phosphate isomerase
MSVDPADFVRSVFREASAAHENFAVRSTTAVIAAAETISRTLNQGGRLLAFGNGGSASDAQHLVAELVGRFETERRPLAAVALTADTNVLTAIANDYGYETVFTRQVEALAQHGDVAFGISTSGRSPNVIAALAAAKRLGLVTIAMTGRDGGEMGGAADIHLNVAESSTARIQEVHRTVLHAICSLVDRNIAQSAKT